MEEKAQNIIKRIRKEVLQSREQLSDFDRERAGVVITDQICKHPWFPMSDIILAFVSYGSEINTSGIVYKALTRDKEVYVPKIVPVKGHPDDMEMVFYRISSYGDLEEGYRGIREPKGDTEQFVYDESMVERVIMLVPGVAFDDKNNRIGYGKGFYDRFLSDKKALQDRTVALGYKCQLVPEIPAREWDIKVHQVICV